MESLSPNVIFRRRAVIVLIAFPLLVVGVLILTPLLTYPFGRDQGVFAAAADILAQGGVPYRDIWDVKPPGVFYAYWASFILFGRSTPAPRAFDILWTLATATAIWALGLRLAAPWERRRLACIVSLFAAFLFLLRYIAGNTYWNTTQADGFASLPLCLAIAALISAEERKHNWLAIACGACVALAVLFKLTLGVFLLIPVLAAFLSLKEPIRRRLGRAACYLLGCAGVLAIVAVMLWRAGALGDAVDVLVRWNAQYSRLRPPLPMTSSPLRQTANFLFGLPHYPLLFFVGLLALIGAVDLAVRPASARIRWLLPAWAGVLIASVWAQGKFYTYHWLPVLPPLCLLAAQGLRSLSHLLHKALPARSARAVSALGLLAVFALSAAAYWRGLNWPLRYLGGRMTCSTFTEHYDRYGDFSLLADKQVAYYLLSETAPDDTIFIWGFEPLIYAFSDRQPASRFIYNVPLVTDWSPPAWRVELLRDLETKRPRMIAVVHNDILPWMNGRFDDSAAQLADYPELALFLERNYLLDRRIEDFDLYRLR